MAFAFKLPSQTLAREVEREIHDVYKRFRLHGEWFDVDPFILINIVGVRISISSAQETNRDHLEWLRLDNERGVLASEMFCQWKCPEEWKFFQADYGSALKSNEKT